MSDKHTEGSLNDKFNDCEMPTNGGSGPETPTQPNAGLLPSNFVNYPEIRGWLFGFASFLALET